MPDPSIWAGSYGPGVPLHLEYGDETLVDQLENTIGRFGDRPALEFLGRSTSYTEFGDQVARAAEGLRGLGVRAGDHVALLMPTCPQHLVAFHAVLRLGATAVEHNPLYTTGELKKPFADHQAKVALVWDKAVKTIAPILRDPQMALQTVVTLDMTQDLPLAKRLALRLPVAKARATREEMTAAAPGFPKFADLVKAAPLDPAHPRPGADDVALLLYTSGTSGTPKGVPLLHRNVVANCAQGVAWVPELKYGQERWLSSLPMFHAYGLTVGLLCGIRAGAELVLLPKPDTALMVDALKRREPTFVPGVPPIYRRILEEAKRRGVSMQSMRFSISGAMALPAELVQEWQSATGGSLVEGYGLTETAPLVIGNPMNQPRPGSIGVPVPDTLVRIVDPENPGQEVPLGERGELVVKGPQVFGGYRDRPEETAEVLDADGWFRTGDIVTMAEDGYISVVDRIKEVVIVGGFNVYPSEVEEVLRSHPSVQEAAVVGVPDEDGHDEVVAAVVAAEGQSIDQDALGAFLREELTRYKVPRRFVPVEKLPVNPMGKVLRREVADLVKKS
ncbi:long-chain-fatty-acid--CoA ligase [Kineosporia sp. NBRC 101677]|uniref:long-chain-fatty-acid--CoA ligase n=1 Tax=Kineosporia sp. NBRC 101677 TaxID=3032197 RepID=UPI0024A1140A|nr:long-chain-fatty-acid--CoA ligase [Kineosporia sp. NBRC 101677]GLY17073.1 long-chain-fatty-acid--CoA ligase [Kineosporia sp. NBRC 101677]